MEYFLQRNESFADGNVSVGVRLMVRGGCLPVIIIVSLNHCFQLFYTSLCCIVEF